MREVLIIVAVVLAVILLLALFGVLDIHEVN